MTNNLLLSNPEWKVETNKKKETTLKQRQNITTKLWHDWSASREGWKLKNFLQKDTIVFNVIISIYTLLQT